VIHFADMYKKNQHECCWSLYRSDDGVYSWVFSGEEVALDKMELLEWKQSFRSPIAAILALQAKLGSKDYILIDSQGSEFYDRNERDSMSDHHGVQNSEYNLYWEFLST
jgi:hypothetical protein